MAQPITEQTQRALYYALKEQSVKGVYETGAGGTLIPFVSSPGIVQENADVQDDTSRSDLLFQLGDYGQGSSPFSLTSRLIIGAHDLIDQAVLRSSYDAAATITEADLGGIASVSGKTVTFDNPDVLTNNLEQGDVITPLTGFDAADVNEHYFIEAATTTSITLDKAPATSGAVAVFSFRRERRCSDGETDCAFTVEEYFENIDQSAIAEWIRFGELTFGGSPNSPVQRTFRGRGRQMIVLDNASSPALTDPAAATGLAISDANKELSINGAVVGKVSAHNFTHTRPDFLPPTSTPIPEEIGLGTARVTGSVTLLRSSLEFPEQFIQRLRGFSIGIKYFEPTTTGPSPFQSAYVSNCRWLSAPNGGAGNDGFDTITMNFEGGVDLSGGSAPKQIMKLSNWVA